MIDSAAVLETGQSNMPDSPSKFSEYNFYLIGLLILISLYFLSTIHFLLFHSIAEGFSIVIACGIFMVVWNSRQFFDNNFFLFVGIAYLFIAFIDLFHMLAYRGIGVFTEGGTNLPTQLWISSRYMQALTFLVAPFFIQKKINTNLTFAFYIVATFFIITSIFYLKIFPDCYIDGYGLTGFKKNSEYIISVLFIGSVILLYRKRSEFNKNILLLVISSVIITIISEILFTLYSTSYGKFNAFGHIFKIVGFYLLYKAIIQTGLRHPYNLMFRKLKQNEEALQLTRYSIDRADDLIIWFRPDCTISDINNTTSKKLGYSQNELLNMHIYNLDQNLNQVDLNKVWSLMKSKGNYTAEHKIQKRDGTYFETEAEFNYVNFGNEEYCCVFLRDITERKKAENAIYESEQRFRTLADNAPVLIWMAGTDKKCTYCNKTWLEFTGRRLQEELGDGWTTNIHPEDMDSSMQIYYESFEKREEFTMEYRLKRKDGEYRWILDTGVPRFTQDGTFLGYIGSSMDTTEQKNYREQIENSLKEKVVLLKEIHHRVKNNLQVISSLFHLQSSYIKDKDAQNAFLESQDRVKSMALIHEKLYLSKNLSQVNFSQYVHELITSLLSSYKFNSNSMDLVIDIDEIDLNVDVAVNLGLILNELVSNSFKHAFPEGRSSIDNKCGLTILLKTGNGFYSLIIRDNGIGFPENFDINNTDTLGLQLVSSLVEQQNGKIKYFNDNGANYEIVFAKH